MRPWQQLRWKIAAANVIVAAVAVLTYFSVTALSTRIVRPETNAAGPEAFVAGNEAGTGEVATGMPRDAQDVVGGAYRDSTPIALAFTVITTLAASLLLTKVIMDPYARWEHDSRRIARGLYRERLKIDSHDELGEVAASFNVMAEALDSVQQNRVALIGYLSHELRTPLSGVSGYIEGIMDGLFPDTEATLALMYGEVRRMRRLVDDLQTLSRVQAGEISLRMGTFELPAFVKKATIKLQPQWITSGINVEVIEPKKPLVVIADPDRVDQILLNLLANSLANTPEGGTVTVEILQDGSSARVDITDTGYGIPDDEMPFIFERYYRTSSTTERNVSGSGIGLSISRHLAWAMGGELVAVSDGPNMGSTFSFFLPLSKSHVASE
ncbi:MAG: sensor histidine kinase [Candidatus Promineifilaceae bacterium]|jgi:signal transduction histidine kinase